MSGPANLSAERHRLSRMAGIAMVMFMAAVLGVGLLIQITSAVIGQGVIISQGQNIRLQHPDGGRIAEVRARNGEPVVAGTTLLVLDGSDIQAELDTLIQRRRGLEARLERLNRALGRDVDGLVTLRRQISAETPFQATQSEVLAAEEALARSEMREAASRAQAADETLIDLQRQIRVGREQLELIEEELPVLQGLVDEQLVQRSRLTQLQRQHLDILQRLEALQLEATRLRSGARLAREEGRTIANRLSERRWRELEAVEVDHADTVSRIDRLRARQDRLDVTAPIDGHVHELVAANPGPVVSPGDVLLQLVPLHRGREIEVRIAAADVDDVQIGQAARIRFDTFRHLGQAELAGTVAALSPDRSVDLTTGEVYFSARVTVATVDQDRFAQIDPASGVPVTVLIETRRRSLLSYLLDPLLQAFGRTFREN